MLSPWAPAICVVVAPAVAVVAAATVACELKFFLALYHRGPLVFVFVVWVPASLQQFSCGDSKLLLHRLPRHFHLWLVLYYDIGWFDPWLGSLESTMSWFSVCCHCLGLLLAHLNSLSH